MKTITINVSEPVYEEFREYARAADRSTSELIRQAMEEFRDRRIRHQGSVSDIAPLRCGETRAALSDRDDLLDEMLHDLRS